MMAEKLLLTVLEISIASSPVILLLLLVAPFLGKRYGSKLRCLVWLALAVRMMIPLNMPLQNAITINLFSTPEAQTAQYGWFLPNPAQIIERESEPAEQNILANTETNRRKSIRITPVFLAAIIWAAGTALFLLYHLGAYFYTMRRLRRWSVPIRDEEILRRFESVKNELSIGCEVQLYQSSKAAGPLLMGFVRPHIILPERPLTQEQLDFMLRHELWHLRRGDLWYKLLMLLTNAVHWFNPLVWIMNRQANMDTELACDADVLRKAEQSERKAYGYTVLSFMEQGWRCKTPLTSRFYGGKKQMKQRFYNITDTTNKKRGTALLCTIAMMIALAGCAVHATAAEQDIQTKADTPPATEISAPSSDESVPLSEVSAAPSTDEGEPQPEITPVVNSQDEIDAVYESTEWSKNPYSGGEMAWPFPGNTGILATVGMNPKVPNDMHTGIDIAGDYGATIIAANDGTVMRVSKEWTPGVGYGMYVIIDHGGEMATLYAHCSEILVAEGDHVAKGEKIAEAGTTGFALEPHLHFEVRLSGSWVDPMPYITSTGFIWPTIEGGYISAGVGAYPGHTGMDIAGLPEGTPVYAAAAGTVVTSSNSNVGYGKWIRIDHGNGYQTVYAHNSELYVNVGDIVSQGQVIAAIGRSGHATGYLLHFEVRHDGKFFNPEDFLTNPADLNPPDDVESAQTRDSE